MKMRFGQGLFPRMSLAPDERMQGGLYIHQDGDGIDGGGGGGGGGSVTADAAGAQSGDSELQSTADQLSQGLAGFSQQLQTLQDGLARVRKERDDAVDAKEKLGQKLAREMAIVGSVRTELRATKNRVAELEEQLGKSSDRVVDASIWGALNALLESVRQIKADFKEKTKKPLQPFLAADKLQNIENIETALAGLETAIEGIMSSAFSGTPVEITAAEQPTSTAAEAVTPAETPAPVEEQQPVKEKPAGRSPSASTSAGEIAAVLAGEDVAQEWWFDSQQQGNTVEANVHWTRRIYASIKTCYGDNWTQMASLFFESLRVNRETQMPGVGKTNHCSIAGLIENGAALPTDAREGRRAAHKVIRLSKLAASGQISEQYVELDRAFICEGWNPHYMGEEAVLGMRCERFVVDALRNDDTMIAVESESMHHSVSNLVALLLLLSNENDAKTLKPTGTTREQWEEALRFVNRLLMHRDYVAEGRAKSVELHITSKTITKRVVEGIFSIFERIGKPNAVRIIWYEDGTSRPTELRRGGGDSPSSPASRGTVRPHRTALLMDLKHSKGRSAQQEPAQSKKPNGRKKRPSQPDMPAVPASPAVADPDETVHGYISAQDVARAAERPSREEPAAVEEQADVHQDTGMTPKQIAGARLDAQTALFGLVGDRQFIEKSQSHKAKREAFIEAVLGGFEDGRSIWQERVEFLPTHSAKVSELLKVYGEWPGSRSKNGSDIHASEAAREEDPTVAKFMTGAESVVAEQPTAGAEPVVEEEPTTVEDTPAVDEQAVPFEADDMSGAPSAVEEQTAVAEEAAVTEPAVVEKKTAKEHVAVEDSTLNGTDALSVMTQDEPDIADGTATVEEPAAEEEPVAAEEPAPVEPQVEGRFTGFDAEAGAVRPASVDERPTRKMRAVKVKAKKTRSREFPRIRLEKPLEDTQDYADLWDEVYQLNILERENHNQAVVDRFVKWALAKGEYEKLFESDRELPELIAELYQRWVELGKPTMDQFSASDLYETKDDEGWWRVYVEWQRRNRWPDPDELEAHRNDDFYISVQPWQTEVDEADAWKLFDKLRSAVIDGHKDYAAHRKDLMQSVNSDTAPTSDIANRFVSEVISSLLNQEWALGRIMFRERVQNLILTMSEIYEKSMGNGFKFNTSDGRALIEILQEAVLLEKAWKKSQRSSR